MADNLTHCTGDDLDSCRGIFPNKDHAGLCGRCHLLKDSESNPDKVTQIMSAIHCVGCGTVGKHFSKETRLCGRCQGLAGGEKDSATENDPTQQLLDKMAYFQQEAQKLMATARGDAYTARTAPTQPSSSGFSTRTVPPGNRRIANAPTAPSTATAAAPSSGDRLIYVSIEARVGKQICHHLGQVSRSHSADRPVPEIVEECLKSWNEDFWERNSEGSLSRDDVSLRWYGNVMPEPETEGRRLGDFYDIHYSQPHRLTYFGRGPKTLKARELKGVQQIFLELVIDVKGFAERTGCNPPSQLQAANKGRPPKRRDRSASPSHAASQPEFKRPQPIGGSKLPMSVVPRLATGISTTSSIQPRECVELVIASTAINQDDYTLDISWDIDDGAKVCTADISETVSWSGKTKHVFTIDINLKDGKPPQPFVAKRFFDIGGEGSVSCADNAHFLGLEAQRLELGNVYLSEFYKHARTQDAQVSTDFGFSQYLLARENTEPGPDGASPSKASGISPEKWRSDWPFSDWDAGIVWLLEPRRSHLVDRWSGTLAQPNHRQNKRFATMGAFAHFTMLLSEMNIVFVDLQSSYGNLRDGHGHGRVLFDPMTHSRTGSTGVGDHGMDGLCAFIDQHECTSICARLDLESLSKAQMVAEDVENEPEVLNEADQAEAGSSSDSEGEDED